MYLQTLMMLKTVQKRHTEIIEVQAQLVDQVVKSLLIKFSDASLAIVMVNINEPTPNKVGSLIGVDSNIVTFEA